MGLLTLRNVAVAGWLQSERSIDHELRSRCISATGQDFARIAWNQDRLALCLEERTKPIEGHPEGIWTISYELRDDEGTLRTPHGGDVLSVMSRVYGTQGSEDDWHRMLKLREDIKRTKTRQDHRDHVQYVVKRAAKARRSWRSSTFVGAPGQLNQDRQYFCGHGRGVVAAECETCRAETRSTFYMSR